MRRRFRRAAAGVLLAILALALVGGVTEAVAANLGLRRNPAPGNLVDVGGRQIHIQCVGQGSPTVVLEAGAPRSSLTWVRVMDGIGRTNRVCAYDRAGLGWSEPARGERTGADVAADLHTLLEKAGEKPPYIMVAHSFGGLYPRLYAHRYKGEVVGMVFVDALHEDLLIEHGDQFAASLPLLKAVAVLAPVGLVRLLGALGAAPWLEELERIPAETQAAFQATSLRTGLIGVAYAENAAGPVTARLNREAGRLGDMPVVVITAGLRKADDWPSVDVWESVQQKLAALSTRSSRMTAERSDHFVQLDQPELVVEAVAQVAAQVR